MTKKNEPARYLGAVGLLGLAGLLAIFGAPFRRETYRELKPTPPVRHPTEW